MDTEGTPSPITLTDRDWLEIAEALASKRSSPTCAGTEQNQVEWREHLQEIMDNIGPDGIKAFLNGVAPGETVTDRLRLVKEQQEDNIGRDQGNTADSGQ